MDERTLALFEDKAFLKKVLVMEPEEAQKAFAEAGGTITADELKEIAAQVNAALEENAEFDETSLEEVTGGITKQQADRVKVVTYTVAIATAVAIAAMSW